MADANINNPLPLQEAPPALPQPIRNFRELAQQPIERDNDDCTEHVVALGARKREDEAAAMQRDLIRRLEAFLANPNVSSLQAAQSMVQTITDLELRKRMQTEMEKKMADMEAEANGRAAIGVVALLGEPCMNTIYNKPCTRLADPKLGNHLCCTCHKSLTRLSNDLSAAERMTEKENRKRQRKEDKERHRQQLLDAINEKRARRSRVVPVVVAQRSVQNDGRSNAPMVAQRSPQNASPLAIASCVPPRPPQQLTGTAPSFSLIPYIEPTRSRSYENPAHLQLEHRMIPLSGSNNNSNRNKEVDLDADYNDADAHEDAMELAEANENDANDSDYNEEDEFDDFLNGLDIDEEEDIDADEDSMDID